MVLDFNVIISHHKHATKCEVEMIVISVSIGDIEPTGQQIDPTCDTPHTDASPNNTFVNSVAQSVPILMHRTVQQSLLRRISEIIFVQDARSDGIKLNNLSLVFKTVILYSSPAYHSDYRFSWLPA